MKIPKKNNKITSAVKVIFRAVSLYLTSKKIPDVKLAGYYVTHNGKFIVFDTGADAPNGEIRCISKNDRENKMFVSFYSLPAVEKSSKGEYLFPVKLSEYCTEIYLYCGKDDYRLALRRDLSSGKWIKHKCNMCIKTDEH